MKVSDILVCNMFMKTKGKVLVAVVLCFLSWTFIAHASVLGNSCGPSGGSKICTDVSRFDDPMLTSRGCVADAVCADLSGSVSCCDPEVAGGGSSGAAPAPGTVGGACVSAVADHLCLAVPPGTPEFTAQDCQRGHCGTLTGVFCCRPPAAGGVPALNDACGAAIVATRPAAGDPLSAVQADWTCRIPQTSAQSSECRGAGNHCTGFPSGIACCPPGVGNAPGRPAAGTGAAAPGATTAATPATSLPGALGLPNCATTHDPATAGKCTLEDIKTVAVNFANFLMGLAAAVFLAIFVWAGFRYIFFAYDSSAAGEARKMLTSAAIGMLLVLGAALIVRFVQTAATGQAPTSQAAAVTNPPQASVPASPPAR